MNKPIPYKTNPRSITEKDFELLKESLKRNGDLSGIVHDLNSNQVVGGNQRSRAVNLFDGNAEIVIETQYDEPDNQGTVAWGYVLWEGNRYSYRAVRFTPEQCDEANILANSVGGDWDWDILANMFEPEKLVDMGFKTWQVGLHLQEEGREGDKPPSVFPSFDENLKTEYCCPSCGYEWSGKKG